MIKDTLAKLETAIAAINASNPAKQSEAARLLKTLRDELALQERSRSTTLEKLQQATAEFEITHPRLAETIGDVCRELASLGI
jgi:hypothetical protein